MASLGTATLVLEADDKKLDKDLDRAESRVGKFGKAAALGLAGAGVAAVGGIAAVVKSSTDLADELYAVSNRTGIAVGELHGLRNIANHLGSEDGLEGIVDSAQELGLRLQDMTADGYRADAALAQIGLSGDELRKKTPTEAMYDVIEALQGVEDEQKRAWLADELMGGSWEKISGILAVSSDEFKKLREQEQGVVSATQAVVEETFRMQTAWRDITRIFADAGGGLQAGLMSKLADLLELVRDNAPAIKELAGRTKELLINAITPLGEYLKDSILPKLLDLGRWFIDVGVPALKRFRSEGLFYFYVGWYKFQRLYREHIEPIWQNLKLWIGETLIPTFNNFKDKVRESISDPLGNLKQVYDDKVKPFLTDLKSWLTETGLPKLIEFGRWIIDVGIPKLKELGGTTLKKLMEWFNKVKDAAVAVFDFFTKGKEDSVDPLIGTVEEGNALWQDLWSILYEALKPALEELWDAIKSLAEPFQSLNKDGGDTVKWSEILEKVLIAVAHIISTVLVVAISSVTLVIKGLLIGLEVLVGAFNVVRALIAGDWTLAWLEMQNAVGRVWNAILDYIEQGINNAIRLFNKLIDAANLIPGVDIGHISDISIGGRIDTSGVTAEIAAHKTAQAGVVINELNVTGVLDEEGVFDTVADATREAQRRGIGA